MKTVQSGCSRFVALIIEMTYDELNKFIIVRKPSLASWAIRMCLSGLSFDETSMSLKGCLFVKSFQLNLNPLNMKANLSNNEGKLIKMIFETQT